MTTGPVGGAGVLPTTSFTRLENTPSNVGGSVLNEGVNGLRNASSELLNAANTIARSSVTPENRSAEFVSQQDLAQAVVEQREAQVLFNASAEVVSVADEVSGRIIDEIV